MPEAVGTLLGVLAARVRDPQFTATSRDDMRLLLGWSQRYVNAKNESVQETLSLTTTPNRILYQLSVEAPRCVRVTSIREGKRDLVPIPYRSLRQGDLGWFRQVGPYFLAWSIAGRDQLFLWPARRDSTTVELRYTLLTDMFVQDSDLTVIPDEELDEMLEFAEALVNLRQRALLRVKEFLETQAS